MCNMDVSFTKIIPICNSTCYVTAVTTQNEKKITLSGVLYTLIFCGLFNIKLSLQSIHGTNPFWLLYGSNRVFTVIINKRRINNYIYKTINMKYSCKFKKKKKYFIDTH